MILVFGKNGQVGSALQELAREMANSEALDRLAGNEAAGLDVELSESENDISNSSSDLALNGEFVFADRTNVDLTKQAELISFLDDQQSRRKIHWIINAAAYTAVDRAESEVELAHAINAKAPEVMAKWCETNKAALFHFSTDYIFSGKGEAPWLETDTPGPLNTYGASKLAGELAVRQYCRQHIILRASWVFHHTGVNFLKTMLKLGSEREILSVVSDQFGAPTSAESLALAVIDIIESLSLSEHQPDDKSMLWGTYHFASQGATSWHGFAELIFREAALLKVLLKVKNVQPCTTLQYPTPARRPLNSRMNTDKFKRAFQFELPTYQESVRDVMRRIYASH
jgi:dTDP-4-dehydrorhamnose reductase